MTTIPIDEEYEEYEEYEDYEEHEEYYTLNWLWGRLLLGDAFQTYIRYL